MNATAKAEVVDSTTLAAISDAEINRQIATARAYPRSIRTFRQDCLDLATLTEQVAEECIYAIPRGGKMIEGPSARLAEIVAHAWGNCRAGARVVTEDRDFVVAQGAFMDLEKNVAITYEVKRRITDRNGRRYDADMIAVTANAACSIALRNAVFKGVPKAFWQDIYQAARVTAVGNAETLANRRAAALAYLQKMGAPEAQVLKTLGVKGVEDIGLEELAKLKGIVTAIKDGETSVDMAFGTPKSERGDAAAVNQTLQKKEKAAPAEAKKPEPKAEKPAAKEPTYDAAPSDLDTLIADFRQEITKAPDLLVLGEIDGRVAKTPPEVQEAVAPNLKQKRTILEQQAAKEAAAGKGEAATPSGAKKPPQETAPAPGDDDIPF